MGFNNLKYFLKGINNIYITSVRLDTLHRHYMDMTGNVEYIIKLNPLFHLEQGIKVHVLRTALTEHTT
jgi:hypothetical protein